MDFIGVLAVTSLILGLPIIISGAIELNKGNGLGFVLMICGCFCLYNGVTYYIPDKDVDKQPIKEVVENIGSCTPIAKAAYINEYGVFDLYYQKCSSGKVEDVNKDVFNKLDVIVDNNITSTKARLETISNNYIFPIGFIFILMAICLILVTSIKEKH